MTDDSTQSDLREQERLRLAAIVDQIPGGLVVAEAPSGRVVIVNEQARQTLGPMEDDASFGRETILGRALEGQSLVAERVEIVKPDGEPAVLSVNAVPVRDDGGRITAAVSMFEDITASEARHRAERDFVTNAAHELQSPLAAITSAVDVLQAGAKDAVERDLFIEHIERESQRLVRLTRALLTLARAQTEVEEPRAELIDLGPLLEAIAARMEPAPDVTLTVECPADLALVSNRELLEQAISNVVRNAVKYTDTGSIVVAASRRDSAVEISVVDTGAGIPAEALARVAERFYRAEGSKDGFGLGLAIVEAAVGVLGGKLEVASEGPGQGTSVAITLPLGAKRVAR